MKIEISDEAYSDVIYEFIHNCKDEELFRFFEMLKGEITSRIVHINEDYARYWKK